MILLNLSHPLTPAQLEQVVALAGKPIDQVIELPVQFDSTQPFLPQLAALAESIPLSAQQLQGEPIIVNPPSLNFITALLLAELHGRMGYFPPVLRLRLVPDSLPPQYEVAEILNLQVVREDARRKR
jgi:hypothetical protein